MQVFSNQRALPVAWFVESVRIVDDEEALRLIRSGGPEFEPEREVLSEAEMSGVPQSLAGGVGSVDVEHFAADELLFSVETPETAVLVTSERYDPGWKVEIDGVPAEVRRVNFGFRGVIVPPGAHEVRFVYRPIVARIGFGLSAFSLVALLGCAVLARRQATLG